MIPESMLWLLLTGKVPTAEQTKLLSQELAEKGDLPKEIEKLVDEYVISFLVLYLSYLLGKRRNKKLMKDTRPKQFPRDSPPDDPARYGCRSSQLDVRIREGVRAGCQEDRVLETCA